MQRKIGTELNLSKTVSPFDSTSSVIDRTASNFLNASEKVQKIKNSFKQGNVTLTLQVA